jgi:hypothetical protein
METEVLAVKRPGWVWVISIFFFLSAGWTLLSFLLVHSGAVSSNAAQIAYFDSLSALDYISSVGIGFANFIGAISLFLLRKISFYLFASALGANLLLIFWHAATKGWVAALGSAGLVGAALGLGLLFAVCAYCRRLLQQGVLR